MNELISLCEGLVSRNPWPSPRPLTQWFGNSDYSIYNTICQTTLFFQAHLLPRHTDLFINTEQSACRDEVIGKKD